ncbi:hypothetical protein U1Q18_041033 [Sarracenia purpurea var. burkii]
MRREGRQHGMVRTSPILPWPWNGLPDSRPSFDSPATAGLFIKVSAKPTNHSKFTAKCKGCHTHPASKSKGKAKGNQKLRSCDVVSNSRLLTWRVVDTEKSGLKFAGFSGSGILDHLASDYSYMDNEDDYYDDCVDEVHEGSCDVAAHHHCVGFQLGSGAVEIKVDAENQDATDEDEDWCLVLQM